MLCEAGDSFEICIVLDRYLESSLKESTRENRGRRLEVVEYEIVDSTKLKKIHSMRKFLSPINTKQRLAIYLGRYLSNALTTNALAISYNTLTVSNLLEIGGRLNGNTREEADNLMILYAINVALLNPFWHVRVISLDTDFLLLLTQYYPQLPVLVLFESGSYKINIAAAYEVLGPEKSNALLGYHAFTGGCDQTSKVNGKSKATCWKA